MKCFTPELYVEFNSDDPAIADKADADWEQATSDYRRHVRKINGQLPGKARELAVVAVEKADDVLLLIYVLAEEPTLSAPDGADVFSDTAVHWVYDEVDATDGAVFSHEILLSNGRTLSMTFVAFDMLTVNKEDFEIPRADRTPAVST